MISIAFLRIEHVVNSTLGECTRLASIREKGQFITVPAFGLCWNLAGLCHYRGQFERALLGIGRVKETVLA